MGGKEQTRAVAEQGFGCGPSAIGSARLPCARLSPESMGEPRHRTPHVVSWGGGGGTFSGGDSAIAKGEFLLSAYLLPLFFYRKHILGGVCYKFEPHV